MTGYEKYRAYVLMRLKERGLTNPKLVHTESEFNEILELKTYWEAQEDKDWGKRDGG